MSGSYDLEPVMLSIRSSYVKISKEEQCGAQCRATC